jgi:glyoxylase-like metal-dependent hydrolase (beta-lactamase superfamily II)
MQVGNLRLDPLYDGTFIATPRYFGEGLTADARPDLFTRHGSAWLPIGCFVVRGDDRVVLVDAGLGPELEPMSDSMYLVGGQLPTGLRALGVSATEITDVICTHFHADHVGWLFDADAHLRFPNASIWFGNADWERFVMGPGTMRPHIRRGFKDDQHSAHLRPIDRDTPITSAITALQAPGHTPGHMCLVIASGIDRVLLLGDAITCPIQLDEPTWHSMSDVDAALAQRTRERLWRELEQEGTVGTGAHFPELQFGRVLPGTARRWFS